MRVAVTLAEPCAGAETMDSVRTSPSTSSSFASTAIWIDASSASEAESFACRGRVVVRPGAREDAIGINTVRKLDAFDRAQRIDAVVTRQVPDLESAAGRADGIIRVRTRVDDSVRAGTAVERVAAGTACDDIVAARAHDRIVAGAAHDALDAGQRGRGQVDRAAVAGELQDVEAVAAVDDLDVR